MKRYYNEDGIKDAYVDTAMQYHISQIETAFDTFKEAGYLPRDFKDFLEDRFYTVYYDYTVDRAVRNKKNEDEPLNNSSPNGYNVLSPHEYKQKYLKAISKLNIGEFLYIQDRQPPTIKSAIRYAHYAYCRARLGAIYIDAIYKFKVESKNSGVKVTRIK